MTPRAATFLMFAVNGVVVGTWYASLPGIQANLDASATEIGLILLAMALGALVSQQVTGQLLIRFDSRHVLTATALIFPLLTPLPLLAPTPLVLAGVMFFFGAINTAMDVSMNQHGVALEESGGTSILSGLHGGWSIGGAVGAVAVAVAVAVGVAVVTEAVLAAAVMWLVVVVSMRHLGTGSVRTEGASGIHWPSRAVLPIALLIMLAAFVEGGLSDWGGIYMRQGIGSTAGVAAFAFAALSIGLAIGRLAGDRVKDRIGSVQLIRYGLILSAIAIIVMLVVGEAWVAIVGLVVAGIGVANSIPQLFGAAGRIPPYGPSLSAGFTFLTMAFMIGPVIIGVTSDAVGITLALGLVALAAIIGAVAVTRVPRAETSPDFQR